ncbi:hypothetical protein AWB78_00865 [Caballeronia calidae]|uniref:Uncharacterized protein n=1 Tax=Caballeronia calidae TaxID=1777139 RepID=A0A157ZRZ9_9BURK|nr:hypothetical protein [Caballeronia calidae]SAK48280.1 hypothetical protein AWB78_00865 [Caballeronia calidae]
MPEELLSTQAAAELVDEAIPEAGGSAYWSRVLTNNRREERNPPHRIPFERIGTGAFYRREDVAAFIEFEKSRRLGVLKLSGRAAEAIRAFGIGEKGGSASGRKLNVSAVTLQLDQTTGARFVQLVTSDPLMVYRLELGEAKALAKELADVVHAGERGAR